MLFEELIMDSSTLMKYRLFKNLMAVGRPSYPISQLASEMDLNYQQTVIDLTEIDTELSEIDPNHQSIFIGAGKLNCLNLSCSLDNYRYYLLKHSIPFQFVLYFLNEENPTIDDFCTRYESSRSTVARKIDKLKRHLKTFHIRFTYTEAGIVGDERMVRLALFNMIWLGVRGLDWPFAVSEEKAEALVTEFSDYFPLSRTYLGRLELRYFAAIFLSRISKQQFVKYDSAYNFLMQKNPYYDFNRLNKHFDGQLTTRQNKAETSFIYFLAHFVPFYTREDDPSLQQTITDFSSRENPVYPMVESFIAFAKETYFQDNPEVLDQPIIWGNLLNISFAFYVFKQPFPIIQRLVVAPRKKDAFVREMEEKIFEFFDTYKETSDYAYINDQTQLLITKAFKDVLLPLYDRAKTSQKVTVGIALEHNYLLVKNLYQFLEDLHFVDVSPYDEQHKGEYDLVISSSLLLKNTYPDLNVFLWDYSGEDEQSIVLYKTLRNLYTAINQ